MSDFGAALHHCESESGALVYLPALDPLAFDIPGGARVFAPISIGSIPYFGYNPRLHGDCWICAYACKLRTGILSPPPIEAPTDREALLASARVRMRGLAGIAKRALAEVDSERRREADAEAPHYRPATEEEIREEDEKIAIATGMTRFVERAAEAVALGATPKQAVAIVAQNAPIKDDVLEVPPEAIDAVTRATRGRGKKKKFSGEGGGQQSMF